MQLTKVLSALAFSKLILSFSIPQSPFKLPSIEDSFLKSVHDDLLQNEHSQAVKDQWAEMIAENGDQISRVAKGIQGTAFTEKVFDEEVRIDKYQSHKLRVKGTPKDLGIDDVKQYTGYFDMEEEDKHLFYWFFESRNDPKTDPIVLWLNGGPGCSSMMGLFFELGPSSIDENLQPVKNEYSWNNNASVIFLDSPVNTGYSYSSHEVNNTFVTTHDVIAFLEIFFTKFPEFLDVPFHIAGESYGGHYVPRLGRDILAKKDKNFELQSIMIGNGLTDMLVQYEYYQPMACGEGGYPAVVDEEKCQIMKDNIPECVDLIKKCYESESPVDCYPATEICNKYEMNPYSNAGRNMYDVTMMCQENPLCYDAIGYIQEYLDLPEIKEGVGAEVNNYYSCNHDINLHFRMMGDWMQSYFRDAIIEVLEEGLPVLIYAGDKDFICNWLGNQAWTNRLEWSGKEGFGDAGIKEWLNGDVHAGNVKNFENFTFLQVFGAGHMVPFDQPSNSLDMFNRWIGGDRSFV